MNSNKVKDKASERLTLNNPSIPQRGGKKQQYKLVFGLLAAILVVDQIVKVWIKTHMYPGQEIPLIGDWCLLHFVENEGFAFGTSFGGAAGKVVLTLFRFVASGTLLWYLLHIVKKGTRTATVAYLTLILAGALGNLVDSCFYGMLFNESNFHVATLFPPEGGYAPLLRGKVVDMFYFPLFEFDWPAWMPFVGGKHFLFFDAIFNVADAAITIGAFWLIIDILIQDRKKRTNENKNTYSIIRNTDNDSRLHEAG